MAARAASCATSRHRPASVRPLAARRPSSTRSAWRRTTTTPMAALRSATATTPGDGGAIDYNACGADRLVDRRAPARSGRSRGGAGLLPLPRRPAGQRHRTSSSRRTCRRRRAGSSTTTTRPATRISAATWAPSRRCPAPANRRRRRRRDLPAGHLLRRQPVHHHPDLPARHDLSERAVRLSDLSSGLLSAERPVRAAAGELPAGHLLLPGPVLPGELPARHDQAAQRPVHAARPATSSTRASACRRSVPAGHDHAAQRHLLACARSAR